MNQPNFNQPNMQMSGQPIQVILVPNINNIDGYTINPGGSLLFLDEGMTTFKLRSRDQNGFPGPEREWSLKETTPKDNRGKYATKDEVDKLSSKLDEVLEMLKELNS